MKPFLFDQPILPEGFRFPASYTELTRSDCPPDIAPWRFLASDMARSLSYYGDMLLKFSQAPLIPIAVICDLSGRYNDGYVVLACFDGSAASGEPQVRIYDYGRPKISPWENLAYPRFEDWVAAAKEESARYKAELEEDGDE